MIYPNIAIVGPSGSGKSSSIENLDPLTTGIINIEQQNFPFRGGYSKYSKDNHFFCKSHPEVHLRLQQLSARKDIKVIILESFTAYDDAVIKNCRETKTGWDIFTAHNKIVSDFIIGTLSIEDKIIVFICLDEIIQITTPNGGQISGQRIKVEGRELQGKIETKFTLVLFTNIEIQQNGIVNYRFRTNTDGVCSAKSPKFMFKTPFIKNDLKLVIEETENYYK